MLKSMFVLTAHDYLNSRFSCLDELETFTVQQIVSGKSLASLARDAVSFMVKQETEKTPELEIDVKGICKEAGKRLLVKLQLEDRSFKSNDKSHKFYNAYDAYMTELRKIAKGDTVAKSREFSIESEIKRLQTLCEKHDGLQEAIRKTFC